MTRSERATYIARRLAELYRHPTIPLWHKDPFTLLVAVVLSAQCTDVRVNQVTPKLFELADTPQEMAKLTTEKIDAFVRPCGLSPMKAKNIRKLSRLIVERHGGQVPQTFAELEELPGVGHKTASVLMVQAFNQPAFPVDTHILRLAMRWKLSRGPSVEQVERDLKKLYPPEEWHDLHLRIIYFGREYCTARGCDGHTCEICETVNG